MKKRMVLILTVLLTVFGLSRSSFGLGLNEEDRGVAILKSLDYGKTDQSLDVFLELEGVYIYHVFTLSDPLRLAVDLSPVRQSLSSLYYDINEWTLVGVRVGQFHPYIVRIVFDFSESLLPYEVMKVENGLKISLKPKGDEVLVPPPPPPPVKPKEEVRVTPVVAEPAPRGRLNTMIGLSVGSYKISDELFQEVYPGSASIFGLHLSRVLYSLKDADFGLYAEVKKTLKSGAATVMEEEAQFAITPVSIGAAVHWNTKYVIVFAGGGMDFYSYKETSSLYPSPGYVEDSASGMHFQGGAYFRIPTLDALRAKIYYKSTSVTAVSNDIEVNLGGSEFGLSLIFGFRLF